MGYTLVLDPGHQNSPNADTGCSGFGLYEEDIVLDICKRAKPLIEFNGIKVIMTREGATVNGDGSSLNASLNTRCQIANNARADLFLSVHADAYNSQAYGTTAYVYGLGGNAERFAKILNPMMGQLFYNRGIKTANFEVLRDTEYKVGNKTVSIPACLLETAFLDNQSDNAKLADSNIRQQIAIIIAKSVCIYFGLNYKEQNTSTIQSQQTQQGVTNKVKNLVIYLYPEDEGSAMNLARHLQCPVSFYPKQFTSDLLELVENIYQIGGTEINSKVHLFSGNDFDDSTIAYLKFIGKIK